MPITPAALKKRKKAFSFDYLGDTVNIEYYPAMISLESVDQLKSLMAKSESANASQSEDASQAVITELGAWVCTLLASWDYLEDDGETMIPITPARMADELQRFPDFIMAVVTAILQDRTQGNANGTTSPAN